MGLESIFSSIGKYLPMASDAYSAYKQFKGPAKQATLPVANGAIQAPVIGNLPGLEGMPGITKLPVLKPEMQGPTAGETNLGNILRESSDLYRVLLDPTNPVFKRLAADNEALIKRDFASALHDTSRMNERAVARGRTSFFSPERGDEDKIAALANNAADAYTQARLGARGQLTDVASSLYGMAPGYTTQANLETGRMDDFQKQKENALGMRRENVQTQNQYDINKFLAQLGITQQNITNKNSQERENVMGYMNNYSNIANRDAYNQGTRNDAIGQGIASLADLYAKYQKNQAGTYGPSKPAGYV